MIWSSPKSVLRRRSSALLIVALGMLLIPITAAAHPQTRGGLFLGLGLARGSAAVSDVSSIPRESGWGGGFRIGYAPNQKFALGIENSSWIESSEGTVLTIGTFTGTATVFPAEGLALRGGLGIGEIAGIGEGLGGSVGSGWTIGAAYEFRVTPSFAIGPQFDYTGVNVESTGFNFYNVGVGLTWYFIPD